MNELIDRITNYLASGGLFNPGLMDCEKVRDLLIDCRTELERIRDEDHNDMSINKAVSLGLLD
jgi:hypothetical protein